MKLKARIRDIGKKVTDVNKHDWDIRRANRRNNVIDVIVVVNMYHRSIKIRIGRQ